MKLGTNTIQTTQAHANIDAFYGPYESIEIACERIPEKYRLQGLTIGIIDNGKIVEYQWKTNSISTLPEKKDADLLNEIQRALAAEQLIINTKLDTIADLSTIRSGAAAGATAQQPATTIDGYGITDAYTKDEVDSAIESVDASADIAAEVLRATSAELANANVINSEISRATIKENQINSRVDDIENIIDDCVYIGENNGESIITDFDPQTDTLWKKNQVLSNAEKTIVKNNLGITQELVLMRNEIDTQNTIVSQLDGHTLKIVNTLPTDANPSETPDPDVIYRLVVVDGNDASYEDYMYDRDDLTTPIKIATYNIPDVAGVGYYECDSLGNSAAKTISANNYVLSTGGSMKVKMVNANTADNATLNINNTGAKPLYYDGERASSNNSWEAGETVEIYYDGTSYYANSVAGGGKFSTGEKVKEVGIDNIPTEDSPNLVRSGSVYNAYAHQVYLDEEDEVPTPAEFNPQADTVWNKPGQILSETQKKNIRANIGLGNGNIDDEPTTGSNNLVKSGGVQNELALGAIYDVSAKNPTAGPNNDGKWESLSALLSDANLNTLIPTSVRKGGMSVKFVQSVDNKYVQYRYMSISTANEDFTDVVNWVDGDGGGDGVFDISEYNKVNNIPTAYNTLALAIAAVPASKRKAGMSVKFMQNIYAEYQVSKTVGLETVPTGNHITNDTDPNIENGMYVASQLTALSSVADLPNVTGNITIYYIAVTETVDSEIVTTYTKWVVRKETDDASPEYVYATCLISTYTDNTAGNAAFENTNNWQTENIITRAFTVKNSKNENVLSIRNYSVLENNITVSKDSGATILEIREDGAQVEVPTVFNKPIELNGGISGEGLELNGLVLNGDFEIKDAKDKSVVDVDVVSDNTDRSVVIKDDSDNSVLELTKNFLKVKPDIIFGDNNTSLSKKLNDIDNVLGYHEKDVVLMMFMGQSNMAGRGIVDTLHPVDAPEVIPNAGYEFRAYSDPTKLYPVTKTFGYYENNSNGITDTGMKTGGMVPAFVNSFFKTAKITTIGVSASEGGSPISTWQPNADNLVDAIARFNTAVTWLEANGYTIKAKYALWCQGEADYNDYENYITSFDNMANAMMAEGIEKFFIVRIGKFNGTPYTQYDNMILEQNELCKGNENYIMATTVLASLLEKGLMKDEYHYYQEGYNIAGDYAGLHVANYFLYKKSDIMYDVMNNVLFFDNKSY